MDILEIGVSNVIERHHNELNRAFAKLYKGDLFCLPSLQKIESYANSKRLCESAASSDKGKVLYEIYLQYAERLYGLLNYLFQTDSIKLVEYIGIDDAERIVTTVIKTLKNGKTDISEPQAHQYDINTWNQQFNGKSIEELNKDRKSFATKRYQTYLKESKDVVIIVKGLNNDKAIEDNYREYFNFLSAESRQKILSLENFLNLTELELFNLQSPQKLKESSTKNSPPEFAAKYYALYHLFLIANGVHEQLPQTKEGYDKKAIFSMVKKLYPVKKWQEQAFYKEVIAINIKEDILKDFYCKDWRAKTTEIAKFFGKQNIIDYINKLNK